MQSTIATKGLSNLVAGDFTAGYTASVNDDITGNDAQSLKSLSNSNYTTAPGNGDLDDVIDDHIAVVQNSSMNSTLKTYLVNFINDAREIDDYTEMENFTNDAMSYINSNFQSTNKSIAPAWLVGGIAGGIGNSVGAMVADLYNWVVSWF